MPGQSPLNMMQSAPRRLRPRSAAPRSRWRPIFLTSAVVVVLALGWCWLWYYSASIAERALAGWFDREAALGRVYACGAQSIGGFPFSIVSDCVQAAATFNGNKPPFDVRADDITFSAELFRPTLLRGEISGPVTLADPGQSPVFNANWSHARLTLLGLPPYPERVSISLGKPRLDRVSGPGTGMIFQADGVDVDGGIVQGTARSNPVIAVQGHFAGATAPGIHPLLADPINANFDVVLRGFKDFAPKPWSVLFRDMQAAGGGIELRSLRIERPDATLVGHGTLTVNANGRLDGLVQVAVAGVENIVPLLGVDQMIGQGLDRLSGGSGPAASGLDVLDRLMPGLGGVVRGGANAGLIETIKKMGQPTEIDKKPAVALPLRVTDGVISLGLIPLGVVPPLY